MFRKKRIIDDYSDSIKKFDSYFESKHENDYEEIKKTYNYIKLSYLEKIERNELDLPIEIIRLKRKLGKFQNHKVKTNVNLYVSISTVFITLLLETTVNGDGNTGMIIRILAICIGFVSLTFSLIKDADKDGIESLVDSISFEVLIDIEKELEDKKKLDEIQVEDKNTNYEVLKEIAITTSTGVLTNIVGSGIIGKFLKKK